MGNNKKKAPENKTPKQAKQNKKVKGSVNSAGFITSKIPYIQTYEEAGMFKIENGKYSVTYKISTPNEVNELYMSSLAYNALEKIMIGLKDFSYRFTIRNSFLSEENYLQDIELSEDREPVVNEAISDYNNLLVENVGIGHNNFQSNIYLTIVKDADVSDDALKAFEEIDQHIVDGFNDLYGYEAKRLSLEERLRVLYEIYHPDVNSPKFGEKVDFNGTGFSIDNMKRMKMTTKDVIAPKFYEAKERNYMQIGDKFVRMFFINSIPTRISDTLLSDLLSVSSNAILSVSYQPIDASFGFKAAARLVKENTDVKNVAVRDTIEDRKNKRMTRKETMLNETEEEYFNKSALKLLTESAAKEQPAILATFIVGVYSDTLEELDRDTELLKISANKYAVQIKVCDLKQHEAFVTALPLGSTKVEYPRTFNIERLSTVLPVNVQRLFEKKVTFQGLNEINDNFILVDRGNYPIGIIAGMKHSGKTFAMKRDVMNTLMSTNDIVVVVAPEEKRAYDSMVKGLNGDILKPIVTDLFTIDENYGLNIPNESFKKMFLESFITLRLGFHKKKYTTEELDGVYERIAKECVELANYEDYADAVNFARAHSQDFAFFLKAITNYIPTDEYPDFSDGSRMNVIYYKHPFELLLQLDYLWNFAIAMKKMNKTVWIYVDGIDEMIYSPVSSDYLISLLDKCTKLKIPCTMSVQDAAKICSNDVAKIEFDYLLEKANFFKLLTLGVIERKKFVEKLNISPLLVPYITDREPSEGVIITPSLNASFNDRFEKDNAFYKRFQ